MSIISHGGKDYDVPAYSVQDDSSATSLDSSKVPTGGTVQSVYGDPDTHMIKGTDYVTAGKKANTTLGANATAEGLDTTASSAQAHAEGKNTVASGSSSHAEGEGSTASGQNAHAEGWHTTAGPGCHAEGSGSTASVSYSHAEGVSTTASEEGAHAEGYASQATKKGSHSENRAYAQGDFSHAEGLFSKTKAAQAHAEGTGTLASSESQHVQGKYNVEDANGIYAHIVGNGTNSSNRSNIHTLDWSGNAWFAGDVTDGSGNVLSDKADNEPTFTEASTRANIASGESIPTILGKIKKFFTDLKAVAFSGNYSDLSGTPSSLPASDVYSWAKAATKPSYTASEVGALASDGTAAKATADVDGNTISSTYMKKGVDRVTAGQLSGSTLGTRATAEGYDITASGLNSHGEGSGTTAEGENSHAEGNWTFATGFASHTEGEATYATKSYSHAEGYHSTASGNSSHAEGYYNTASGNYSHAEGFFNIASGNYSHAEGYNNVASGNYSHAEGDQTKASSAYQHVEGKYNVEDTNGTYAHIIGGGTANNARKNIFTVDWNGDVNAGRSNGLTNDTKLPTGADVISYLNSNLVEGDITVSSDFTLEHKKAKKYMRVVSIEYKGSITPSSTGWFTIGNIANSAMRPVNQFDVYAVDNNSSTSALGCQVRIATNGDIKVYSFAANTALRPIIFATYIV